MSLRTNPLVIFLRNFGRRLGINPVLARIILTEKYEEKYDIAFQQLLKPGEVVWDIGANVGFYTKQFAEKVGDKGFVYSFEPSPENYKKLSASCHNLANVSALNVALGDKTGEMYFEQGADELGATSRLLDQKTEDSFSVRVATPSSVYEDLGVRPPNAVKVDVEGFEVEVLLGLQPFFESGEIKAIGIEVHFGILDSRGMRSAAKDIESFLVSQNMDVSWVDPSHVIAFR